MEIKHRNDGPLDAALIELHERHIWHANAALSAGRDELAASIAQEFPDAALAVLDRHPS